MRVVNFAHGEMMTHRDVSRGGAVRDLGLDPLLMMLPIAAVLFVLGYVLQ